jgi:nuclear GTP-binding protein
MERTYGLKGWADHEDFLTQMARKSGRLLSGGEPDVDGVAKMVLNDFMRGKIPWFTPVPETAVVEGGDDAVIAGREGRLGEMPRKRKLDDLTSGVGTPIPAAQAEAADDGDEFKGFGSDDDVNTIAPEEADKEQQDDGEDDDGIDSEDMIALESSGDEDEDDGSGEEDSGEEDVDDGDESPEMSEIDIDDEDGDDEADQVESIPASKKRRKAR